MRNTYLILIIALSIVFSCTKEKEILFDSQEASSDVIPKSTHRLLDVPDNIIYTEDSVTSYLGHGIDITGLIEATSVKAKIINFNSDAYFKINLWFGYSDFFSGGNYNQFAEKYKLKYGDANSNHIKALWKLAFNSRYVKPDVGLCLYTLGAEQCCYHFNDEALVLCNHITSEFRDDIESLKPSMLVEKYGTHLIAGIVLGRKLEILYAVKNPIPLSDEQLELACLRRINQYFGDEQIPVADSNFNPDFEVLIYNTVDAVDKYCGLIHATDNNSDSIRIQIVFPPEDAPLNKFVRIDHRHNSIIPIYDLIDNSIKREEVREYIEHYIEYN